MGKHGCRLRQALEAFRIQIGNQDCQRHRQHGVYNQEDNVVQQGVAHYGGHLRIQEKKAEIFQPCPLASGKKAVNKALSWYQPVLLESNHNAKHGKVAECNIPD